MFQQYVNKQARRESACFSSFSKVRQRKFTSVTGCPVSVIISVWSAAFALVYQHLVLPFFCLLLCPPFRNRYRSNSSEVHVRQHVYLLPTACAQSGASTSCRPRHHACVSTGQSQDPVWQTAVTNIEHFRLSHCSQPIAAWPRKIRARWPNVTLKWHDAFGTTDQG